MPELVVVNCIAPAGVDDGSIWVIYGSSLSKAERFATMSSQSLGPLEELVRCNRLRNQWFFNRRESFKRKRRTFNAHAKMYMEAPCAPGTIDYVSFTLVRGRTAAVPDRECVKGIDTVRQPCRRYRTLAVATCSSGKLLGMGYDRGKPDASGVTSSGQEGSPMYSDRQGAPAHDKTEAPTIVVERSTAEGSKRPRCQIPEPAELQPQVR